MTLKISIKKICKISIIVCIITQKSCKPFGKMRNYPLRAISPFVTLFSKVVCCRCVKMRLHVGDLLGKTVELGNVLLWSLRFLSKHNNVPGNFNRGLIKDMSVSHYLIEHFLTRILPHTVSHQWILKCLQLLHTKKAFLHRDVPSHMHIPSL